jgi:hypothetical protein
LLQARGHAATTARDQRLTRAKDAEQLLAAAEHGWVLVTHNASHYKALHDAWLIWSTAWRVPSAHAGILVLPHAPPPAVAREIDIFLSAGWPLANALYFWRQIGGWVRYS